MGTPAAAVSAAAYLLSQLPMLVAVLAIGRLLLPRASRLSAWGTALGVLGCFGHTAFGGLSLAMVMMARDTAHHDTYAALLATIDNSAVMLVSLAGLLGTVVGLLLLGIGLFRTRTGPIWVGPAIWAFLLIEFVGSTIIPKASYVSILLLGAAFIALTRRLSGRPTKSAEPVAAPVAAR